MENEKHGLSETELADLKARHGILKLAELFDSEGTSKGFIVVGKPSANVIGQFEKLIDKDPMKAREVLMRGTLCSRRDEIFALDKNNELYAAAFDAAAQMLPVGKAVLKNL